MNTPQLRKIRAMTKKALLKAAEDDRIALENLQTAIDKGKQDKMNEKRII